LVKIYHREQLIKTQATTRPGSRSTYPGDLPAEKSACAFRDISRLIRICADCGPNTGTTPSASWMTRCHEPGCLRFTG
jgi:hypothetical protein